MCASVNVVQMVVTMRLVMVYDVYVVIDMTEKMTQCSNSTGSYVQTKSYDFDMTLVYE